MPDLPVYLAVAEGDASAGPIALLPTSERFHWLTAPRADVGAAVRGAHRGGGRLTDPRPGSASGG